MKPGPPVNLSHSQTIEAELILHWDSPPDFTDAGRLRYEVRYSSNTTHPAWQVKYWPGTHHMHMHLSCVCVIQNTHLFGVRHVCSLVYTLPNCGYRCFLCFGNSHIRWDTSSNPRVVLTMDFGLVILLRKPHPILKSVECACVLSCVSRWFLHLQSPDCLWTWSPRSSTPSRFAALGQMSHHCGATGVKATTSTLTVRTVAWKLFTDEYTHTETQKWFLYIFFYFVLLWTRKQKSFKIC